MKKLFGTLSMLTATVIWGVSFSAQSTGMQFIEPMLFTALRSITGVIALAAVVMATDLFREKRLSIWGSTKTPAARRELLTGGVLCGIVLAAASVFQQYGLKYTSAGKTGFLTALYIVIVPVLGLFFKRRTTFLLWISVLLGISGAYLLCGGIDAVGPGEICVIICAFIYSIHIMVIDRYAGSCDCIRLSCIQFAVASLLAFAASRLGNDPWNTGDIISALPFWIFCGVGSSAIAFTLQIVAQKYLHPVTATLLMSLESVFAVIGGWIFLKEVLSPREFAGCAVIFCAVILSQLPVPLKKTLPQGKTVDDR